jgi:hypothetical protein
MQAGIATTFLSLDDVLARIGAVQTPKVRGTYKRPRGRDFELTQCLAIARLDKCRH